MRGRFITFEGGEGTGKSTHAATLAARLKALGIGVQLTREPGGSLGAEIMRYVLLSGAAKPLGPERRGDAVRGRARRSSQHADPAGAGARASGWCAIASPIPPASIRAWSGKSIRARSARSSASSSATPGPTSPSSSTCRPSRACSAPPSAAARRGADRFEAEALEFHEKLRDGFLTLAANEPDRCVLIDATVAEGRGRRANLARGRQAARSGHRADPVRGRGLLTTADQSAGARSTGGSSARAAASSGGRLVVPQLADVAAAGLAVGKPRCQPDHGRVHDVIGSSVTPGIGGRSGSVSHGPPGNSELTVTPVSARSCAQISVAASIAALVTP